jgi:hypothetical protein
MIGITSVAAVLGPNSWPSHLFTTEHLTSLIKNDIIVNIPKYVNIHRRNSGR